MRDLVFLVGFLAMFPLILIRPHIGVLIWCWTAILVPNTFLFGLASYIRYNLLATGGTFVGWVVTKEKAKIPWNPITALLVSFAIIGTLSAAGCIGDSGTAWVEWEKFIKILALPLAVMALITTPDRVRALLFAIALSIGFHGIREGAKFVLSGGGHNIWGPRGSIIGDNNHFALAIVVVMPILYFLYRTSRHWMLRLSIVAAAVIQVFTVMGTFSRGGFIGSLALAAWVFVKTKKKLRFLAFAIPLAVAAIMFAPDRWFSRIDTIQTATEDTSFMGRVIAWKQSTLIALDHPILGGGFHAVQNLDIWLQYATKFHLLDFIPTDPPNTHTAFAAHSIYFQVLGDLGFVGLAIFCAFFVVAWRNTSVAMRLSRDDPDQKWNHDLAMTLQYCLLPYIVSGAALNMAYFDLLYVIFALTVVVRTQVEGMVFRRGLAGAEKTVVQPNG